MYRKRLSLVYCLAAASSPGRVRPLHTICNSTSLCRVYRRLESLSMDDDEEEVSREFLEALGPEKLPYLQLIHQLIVCEVNLNCEQV